MKAATTRKYIKAVYSPKLFSVGYCGAQYLLWNVEPFAYNSGVYGWNCDYYYVNGVCICTGYRPHGNSTIGKTAQYEEAARSVFEDHSIPYDEQMERITAIRNEWITKLLEAV